MKQLGEWYQIKDLEVGDWFHTGGSTLSKIIFKGNEIAVVISMWGKETSHKLTKDVEFCEPPMKDYKYLYSFNIPLREGIETNIIFKEPDIYE